MARIRTIKPEFFKHEELFEAESATGLPLRIAFIGLWTCCDREGRFKWRPRQLKTDILPYDEVDFDLILDALHASGMVKKYIVGDQPYGYVPSFLRHQAINQREAKSSLPSPDDSEEIDTHMHARASTKEGNAYQYRGVNIAPALRETIFARDGYKCLRCGAEHDLTVDHIFPQSIGGTHVPSNLRTLCRPCNSGRPVQGQELLDDLAKDGLTMDDMHVTCTHVHARGERKGKEGKGREENHCAGVTPAPTRKKSEPNPLNSATWKSYSDAYFNRYQTEPVRNAKVNSQIAEIVRRLGDDAPHVSAYFVGHQNSWYVQKAHSLDGLVKDAEAIRTQWATNRQVTSSSARSADRLGNASRLIDNMDFDPEALF